ncbi:MAG: hypothetical protein M3O35_10875 [Acidobacteriota bacterium]|nr:hypothetical protein [Acidobacteriota bacterium]
MGRFIVVVVNLSASDLKKFRDCPPSAGEELLSILVNNTYAIAFVFNNDGCDLSANLYESTLLFNGAPVDAPRFAYMFLAMAIVLAKSYPVFPKK